MFVESACEDRASPVGAECFGGSEDESAVAHPGSYGLSFNSCFRPGNTDHTRKLGGSL